MSEEKYLYLRTKICSGFAYRDRYMLGAKPLNTPMEVGSKLTTEDGELLDDP